MTNVLDASGAKFAELYEHDHRRHWVPLSEIPEHVQQAFIAAEDKRFYEHHGVDERSVIRAFMNMMAEPNKRQGGSTITQQVAKNLLVGDDISYERKIREVIVAGRVEKSITKQEILEIYLNSIYLGRSSWGVELAARSYFGKRAKDLTLTEGAFLAGLTKGPAYYNPDKYRERAQGRLAYVLEPHEGGRRHHRGADARGGGGSPRRRSPSAAAARQRLRLRRPDLARGADASPASASLTAVLLRGALDHPAGTAARRRDGAAGRAGAL